MVLDQTGDLTKRDFHKYAKLYDVPEYVKQADVGRVFENDPSLRSTAFADVRNRQFNCSTKAATWVSYLYFLEKQADIHPKIAEWIQDRLDKFTDYWGIAPDVATLKEKHAGIRTEQLRDEDHMLVWEDDAGNKTREYPLRNALEVKSAASWFMKHRDHFVYRDRKKMAEKLLEKTSEYGAGLPEDVSDELEKQACRGTYDPAQAAEHILDRSRLADRADIREGLSKMAEAVCTNPGYAMIPDLIENMCHTLDTFDRTVKLAGQYSELVPRPEEIFCGATYKTAKAGVDNSCMLVTGSVYDKNDFSKLALREVRDAFGSDLAETVSFGLEVDPEKFAEVASTLPRPDAQMLDRIMNGVGVQPLMKHATAVTRPSHQELQELAASN